jgi:hypothetical protein
MIIFASVLEDFQYVLGCVCMRAVRMSQYYIMEFISYLFHVLPLEQDSKSDTDTNNTVWTEGP